MYLVVLPNKKRMKTEKKKKLVTSNVIIESFYYFSIYQISKLHTNKLMDGQFLAVDTFDLIVEQIAPQFTCYHLSAK